MKMKDESIERLEGQRQDFKQKVPRIRLCIEQDDFVREIGQGGIALTGAVSA